MKFKKNWKRFWTLNRHHAEGFTLVELIVVIAILAILSGVAVPAYSGYIEKAKVAADEQLLTAVNTAFAAACIENGVDMADPANGTPWITLSKEGTVNNVSHYRDAFLKYFAGNENAKFEVFKGLKFDRDKKLFVGDPNMVGVPYGEGIIYFSPEDVAALIGSTFLTAPGLGVENVLDQINLITDMVAGIADFGELGQEFMNSIFKSPEFMESAALALGIPVDENLEANIEAKCVELAKKMAEVNKEKDPETAYVEYIGKVNANAAVLFAAQNATKMDTEEIITLLGNESAKEEIKDNLAGEDRAKGLAQASLAYGMYLAYAHGTGNQTAIDYAKNPDIVMDHLGDDDFLAYINDPANSATVEKDLNGYLAALSIVNSSTGDPKAVENLMINGFGDDALADLVQGELDKLNDNG